ncbi:50S ribosomal protein L6 [Patescibacteria group bacterium]|nr:50S ribosomal protein L6 [Patescibacteria group bacterium]
MSRIGKKPIIIPPVVTVSILGKEISVAGPKGTLKRVINQAVKVEITENEIRLTSSNKALWGLFRALIFNMVSGVTEGYEKKLDIEGVGYKALIEGSDLVLHVGFNEPVKVKCPEGIKIAVEKNVISVSGIDKALVGQTAAVIRKVKKAEPYKGKGIKYVGEKIRRKEGKKVVTAK